MHSLLESYLAEVRVRLTALSAERREEEMREMRQHLLDAVKVHRELGQTEDDAAANALAEFGSVEEASGSIRWAWDRDARKSNIRMLEIGTVTSTGSLAYICLQYPPQHRIGWVHTWLISMIVWGLMFGFNEFVQRLPLAGETPLQAPAWLRKRLRRKPVGTVSSE